MDKVKLRKCIKCTLDKPLTSFAKCWNDGKWLGTRRRTCNLCAGIGKKNRAKRDKTRREKYHKFIRDSKNRVCADCTLPHPYWRMQFDHRPGEKKLFNISKALSKGASFKQLADEMLKCDVVCANCHADRTYQRFAC